MADTGAIRMGRAFVELFADDSRLVRGLKRASARLNAWGRSVTTLGKQFMAGGAAIIAPLAAAATTFASMGDQVQKMSVRTGVSAESLSELGFAAEQSGSDLTTLEAGLRKMQRSIAAAADGSQTAVDALAALGLSVESLAGLSPEQQFKLIADRIARIENPTLKAAAAMELFGRSGSQLLPLMQDGAAGIEALQKQARELGLTISGEDANAAAALGDAMSVLWRVLKQGVFVIGSALAPLLKDFAERAAGVIKSVSDWIRQNKAVVATVFKVAAAVMAGGAALVVLGGLISGVGFAFGTLASILTGVGTALGMIGTVLGAILSPVGLVIAALASLGGYLLYVSGAGQQGLSWLGQQFIALRDIAVAAWKGISDALAAGDIGLAAKILWLTLKMEWQKGVNWLEEKWIAFKGFFVGIFQKAVYGIARFLTNKWADIQATWVKTTTFLGKNWDALIALLKKGWNHFAGFFKKVWARVKSVFSDTDAEAEIARINEDIAKKDEEAEKRKQESIAERERNRQQRLSEIEKDRAGTLEQLDKMQAEEQARREEKYRNELKASEDKLAETRRQWQEALQEAARKRAELPETTGPEPIKGPGDLEGLDLEGMAKKSISVRGTFNAMAAQGLAAGGPMERAARASEETAKNTRKLVMQAQHGGLQFA